MIINAHSQAAKIDKLLAEWAGRYDYHRVGHDRRVLELHRDGSIGIGRATAEERWTVSDDGGHLAIRIAGKHGLICHCQADPDGIFRGRWTQFERMPIELTPVDRTTETIVVNLDAGPYFCGIGDAMCLAWVAEGAKGSSTEIRIHTQCPQKRAVLEILGIEVVDGIESAVNLSDVYADERLNRGAVPRVESIARFLRLTTGHRRPCICIADKHIAFADQFWNCARTRILFCPEVGDPARRWPNHCGDQLASMLSRDGAIRTLTRASSGDSWGNTAAIMSSADVVVAVDSAPAHLAALVGKPTIVLLGPTHPNAFAHAENVSCIAVSPAEQFCVGCSFCHPPFECRCRMQCDALAKIAPIRVAADVRQILHTTYQSTDSVQTPRQPLIYETYDDLARRVRAWCRRLPEFVAVAGVPRAGELVAAMIAAERNIHLVHLDDLVEGRSPWRQALRRNCPAKADGDVLVVDDTVSSGSRMRELRQLLPHPFIKFGAVYGKCAGLRSVDFCACPVGDIDHIFEWNWQHHWFVNRMIFEMDGVLASTVPLDTADSIALENAVCLMRPSFEIGEIVTARSEKYRPVVEEWLSANRIAFRKLTMSPFEPAAVRLSEFAEWKALVYEQRSEALLFVESSMQPALTIARYTAKPVLLWPENRILNGVMLPDQHVHSCLSTAAKP